VGSLSDNRGVHVRFYAPDAKHPGDVVMLPADEAGHLTRVLRLKAGAAVRVFNGRGGEFDAVVERAGKDGARVRLGTAREPVPEARVAVTLAQAVLKGDKMDAVVRDAVMMGVAAIQPTVTTRSEVTLLSLRRGRRHDRWQRVAVSSAKQCGRATVPTILEPRTFETIAASLAARTLPQPCLMFVEPAASVGATALSDLAGTSPAEATVLIGPEGGWTAEEVERGSAVSRQVTLGARTLRADTMALVTLTALLTRWGEL
jgi:16S rRNA (uracil1498-N3)-methyltransferase